MQDFSELTPQQLGEKIKAARMAKQMSQTELAEKLGIRSSNISNWERGVGLYPSLPNYLKMAQILDLSDVKGGTKCLA